MRLAPTLLAAALALAASPLARAQAPEADPGSAAPPAPAPASAPADARPPVPAFRLVAQVGWDRGSDELVQTTGGGGSLRANGGWFYAVGAAFLPLLDGRLHTQATIGLKYDVLSADNGDAGYLAFPLEILEFVTFGSFRAGVGVNLHLGGRARIDTTALDETRDLEAAIGLAAQADFVWRFRGAPRGFLTVGPRLVLQEIDVEGGGTVSANAYGVGLGFTF
jgi:hypothetical protein